jgi:hypothetical protein
MIEKRNCSQCGKDMGYCTAKKDTCDDKCRKAKSRKKLKEKSDK